MAVYAGPLEPMNANFMKCSTMATTSSRWARQAVTHASPGSDAVYEAGVANVQYSDLACLTEVTSTLYAHDSLNGRPWVTPTTHTPAQLRQLDVRGSA